MAPSVGRIHSLAAETKNFIRKSTSAHNVNDGNTHDCKSGDLNLHQNVKWRSYGLLSRVLPNEVEKNFPEEEKSMSIHFSTDGLIQMMTGKLEKPSMVLQQNRQEHPGLH